MERAEVLRLFGGLTLWGRGDQRAPHKPLLILYALGCLQRGETAIPFSSANDALIRLLTDFGPPRKVAHTEQPFWRLQNDGIWRVESQTPLTLGADGAPTKTELLRSGAVGMFGVEVAEAFQRDPVLVREIARQLLATHFPSSLHDDICSAVGLDIGEDRATGGGRDPNFRKLVLIAYEHRCAVCGFQMLLSGSPVAIEAAHIKWHQASGPAVIGNGLALCVLHHKVFDLGAFTLNSDRVVLVSDQASGLAGFTEHLLKYHGRPLLSPVHPQDSPSHEFIDWHIREVFRGTPRPL